MNWKRIFIGLNKQSNYLFIGSGEIKKNGLIKWISKSEDKSEEIINAVGAMFRNEIEKQKNKPYFGYELPRIGKLVLIKPGYEFEVKKKRYK